VHVPVLLREVLRALELQPGLTVVDGTVGAGGHSRRILEHIGESGTLVGLDRDPMMLAFAAQVLTAPNCHLRQASYAEMGSVLQELQIDAVDRILLDLGLSSDQLADESRGFSFQAAGPLDLRFDTSRGESAAAWLSQVDEQTLAAVLEEYGEQPQARRLAAHLVQRRKMQPLRTSSDLAAAVQEVLGPRKRPDEKHPATRVFQALRIAVNRELEQLELALGGVLPAVLRPGGVLVVITFHSLEDRRVKQAFRDETQWENLTSKPLSATPAEQRTNPRSRTAKLRAARKK
jgi:16S rRNA (cytosine1402-N4)-methyltransferase